MSRHAFESLPCSSVPNTGDGCTRGLQCANRMCTSKNRIRLTKYYWRLKCRIAPQATSLMFSRADLAIRSSHGDQVLLKAEMPYCTSSNRMRFPRADLAIRPSHGDQVLLKAEMPCCSSSNNHEVSKNRLGHPILSWRPSIAEG
ncbi:hypothetical protein J6590_006348 [Homalodisca vitripennis]|nr:hypothetical protein J6590_006348 [Homalodisca vitripennis]